MSFFDDLNRATEREHDALFEIPFVQRLVDGSVDVTDYSRFLAQAYHHVKHTVPLLMAAGARLPDGYAWLQRAIAHYISEEIGHEEWILSDLEQCGVDPEPVRNGTPTPACELMVSYAYDVIERRHPVGFFGMVHVLERASVRGASSAANRLQEQLGLPNAAFTYLTTHGSLDQDHVAFLEELMNQVEKPADQALVVHCSKMFSKLYGDLFRSLDARQPEAPLTTPKNLTMAEQ